MNLEDEIINLRESVARIEQKIDSRPPCPSPGACLMLEPRIRALESDRDKRSGGVMVLSGAMAVSSALGGLLVAWIKK
jgi:hypothetical protein